MDLEGTTVRFANDTSPDKTVGFKFLDDGEAIWIGLGGLEVDRACIRLDKPRTFHLWLSEQANSTGNDIEEGKTERGP